MSNFYSQLTEDRIRREVREQYNKIIKLKDFGMCTPLSTNCCEAQNLQLSDKDELLGYSKEEINSVSKNAQMGLGCANPRAYAKYKKSETVLDLGCGAGFDCFLASQDVGEEGRVIGVDMMPEMLSIAREVSYKHNYKNVEFRLGEIEHLPIADKSIDIIISNCVLNLSPNKEQVIKECKRVLKKGGRLCIADVLLDDSLLEQNNKEQLSKLQSMKSASCIKNAITISQMENLLEKEGFKNISIQLYSKSKDIIHTWLKEDSFLFQSKIYSALVMACN